MPIHPCHHVYCADIGAVQNTHEENQFGWAGGSICPNEPQASWHVQQGSWSGSQEIHDLANDVADKLKEGDKVALGFECPLWVPVRETPERLTRGRRAEGSPSWASRTGASALATGLAEVPWILQGIRRKLREPYPKVFLNWDSFQKSEGGLFIWEAFVSGAAKTGSHTGDARVGICDFVKALPSPQTFVHPCSRTRSLIGEALLWSGWSEDLCLLCEPCIVIKS